MMQGVGAAVHTGADGAPVDFDLADIDIELEEETEEVKKEINVVPKFMWTKQQEEDLLKAFNLLDHTGEGKIKADDFRVAIKALGYEPTKEELQHMVNEVDKGHSGKLSFENFSTAIARKVMSRDSDVDVMKSFRLFDNDDVGLISFENLKRVTQVIGTYLTDEEIEEMIDDADKDYDGYVSVKEFMRMIRNAVKIVTP
ncbi:caltractin-like [Hyposmocoma kahamanoa]|uniref:caltractin-like n=1 Tax=Hyposmocoma kahamanoa TaxID=1477025 RepID=UPI000E6D6761|nr:caltractin-like [Hyposmocoma kahamanoa]